MGPGLGFSPSAAILAGWRGGRRFAEAPEEVPEVSTFASRMRKAKTTLCPFCDEKIPAPRRMMTGFTPDGCLAERCSCGAVYAVDETGHSGGQALLDAQAVLCDGDLKLAMTLESGKHIDAVSRPFPARRIQRGASRFRQTSQSARAWFVRRRDEGRTGGG